jgi:putative ABC transport system permease protein
VNGKPFEKDDGDRKSITREEELERRFRNRGLNLTYRDRLTESEEIVAGEDFSSETGARKVSVERDFAKRLGLALGDRLVFDVQGVEVEATIANLRRIRWTSFLPNFFLQFAPGVLDDAPKTFLVAVSRLDVEAKQDVQSALVDRFANVSILDVAQVVERILEILGQMHWAMRLMALLVLLVGLAVLFAIVRERAESQTREVALLKAVGAPFSAIGTAQALDGAFLGLAAAFFGSVLAVGAAAVLAYVVFDQRFTVRFDVALGSVFFVAGLSAAASWLATRRSLKTSVRVLLG